MISEIRNRLPVVPNHIKCEAIAHDNQQNDIIKEIMSGGSLQPWETVQETLCDFYSFRRPAVLVM